MRVPVMTVVIELRTVAGSYRCAPSTLLRCQEPDLGLNVWRVGRYHVLLGRTPELSDAGGPARPSWHLMSPARIRSSDFVSPLGHPAHSKSNSTDESVLAPTALYACELTINVSKAFNSSSPWHQWFPSANSRSNLSGGNLNVSESCQMSSSSPDAPMNCRVMSNSKCSPFPQS